MLGRKKDIASIRYTEICSNISENKLVLGASMCLLGLLSSAQFKCLVCIK
jgi:hypothetical protein